MTKLTVNGREVVLNLSFILRLFAFIVAVLGLFGVAILNPVLLSLALYYLSTLV